MIAGVHCADYTTERLAQGCGVESLSLVGQKAALLHDFGGDYYISRVAADVFVGVSGSRKNAYWTTLIGESGLD